MVESFQEGMLERDYRRGRKYLRATVNRIVALMKRIYNLAIREDMALKNPCWKVTMLPENNKRDRTLSVEGFNGLIRELPDHLVPLVTLAYYTGMRLGEILGLTWDRVNMKEGYVDLGPQDTKTSQPRRIYFNEVMWSMFWKASKV